MFNKNFKQKQIFGILQTLTIFGIFASLNLVGGFAQNVKPKDRSAITNCEIVENRINRKFDSFVENRKQHLEIFGKSQSRSKGFLNQAKEQKLDTIQLENDLKVLEEKIQAFGRKTYEYELSIEITRDNACKKPEPDFRNSLNRSREELIQVQVAAQSVKKFFETDIIPDIQEIKSQIK